jgi:hypothetical protein
MGGHPDLGRRHLRLARRSLDCDAPARAAEPLRGGDDVVVRRVGRGVGLLELALGRRSQAERRLRQAIALCERMDARAYLAMTRLDLGALLLPSTEGRQLLDQALTAADELGMTSLGKRAPTTRT